MDHRVRSLCEFNIPYGTKTIKQVELESDSLVKNIENNILSASDFTINKHFFDQSKYMDHISNFKPYKGIINHNKDYEYKISLNLGTKIAVMTIFYEKVPDTDIAKKDVDELEKRIAKVLKK